MISITHPYRFIFLAACTLGCLIVDWRLALAFAAGGLIGSFELETR